MRAASAHDHRNNADVTRGIGRIGPALRQYGNGLCVAHEALIDNATVFAAPRSVLETR